MRRLSQRRLLWDAAIIFKEWSIIQSKGKTLHDARGREKRERQKKRLWTTPKDVQSNILRRSGLEKLDENAQQLYGDFAAVTSFLTLVLLSL